ncbi:MULTISPECIES: hypothetical protein [Bizionia]|uniref:Uncharacterized protein n=1 Tax=Bizionia algoritergicola TaxID=291187 RepID=A0A5D0QT40_9FLAO|nr:MULTISPECIES: hypothetical protein [Bizionia]OBX22841.1 hypothetical protein BAA08_07370 [Bizionia sp. APA-3]TYB72383.1 hypothetical protein ES675_11510 [Bizionia algoritergicola]
MNFDEKFKAYTWKNWMHLHWIINPGLVINELFLGQRVPKITLIDKTTDKPKYERLFIPCPHCETIHDARTWSTTNGTAFKNWFGLFCPKCNQIIPCLTNIFTYIILAITYPIWNWFQKKLKNKWLEKQPKRFINLDLTNQPNPFEGNGWIKQGLSWGLFMFVFMTFILHLIQGEKITLWSVLIGVPIWTIGGMGFGYTMKSLMGKPKRNKNNFGNSL